MTTASNDWYDEFYPPDTFVPADKSPTEYVDRHDSDSVAKVVAEATAGMVEAAWSARRSRFLRWLSQGESYWFGGRTE